MSEIINMCGGKKCCPKIREDVPNKIMHILGDNGEDVPFTSKQVAYLKKYLDTRGL